MTTTILRPYQERAFRALFWNILALQELRRHAPNLTLPMEIKEDLDHTVVLHAPTGSGKTLILTAAAILLVQTKQYDGVLILTPTQDIRGGFDGADPIHVPVGPNPEMGTQPFTIERRGWVQIAEDNVTETIKGFMEAPPHRQGIVNPCGVLVATYSGAASFLNNHQKVLPNLDLSRIAIVVDEAHHISEEDAHWCEETTISRFTDTCRQQGALILMSSATPYRAQGQKTYPNHARIVTVAFDEIEGAPSQIHIDLVGPKEGIHLVASSPQEMEGEGTTWAMSPEDTKNLVQRILRDARGLPHEMKCFLRVPRILLPTNPLQPALEAAGFRVFDATGPSKAAEFQEILEKERRGSFQDSCYDVILICGRGIEGTDWPLCHSFYHLGLCQAVVRVQQILGRTLRVKGNIEGYPEYWRDQASLVFFVPALDPNTNETIRSSWHKHVMILACFIQDHQLARRFLPFVDLRVRRMLEERGVHGPAKEAAMSRLRHFIPNEYQFALGAKLKIELEMAIASSTGAPATLSQLQAAVHSKLKTGEWGMSYARAVMFAVVASGAPESFEFGLKQANFIEALLRSRVDERFEDALGFEKTFQKALVETGKVFDHITQLSHDEWIGVQAKIRGEDAKAIAEELRRRSVSSPSYAKAALALGRWFRSSPAFRLPDDLSMIFGFPRGSYTKSMFYRDLAGGKLKGQPEHIKCFRDLQKELGEE